MKLHKKYTDVIRFGKTGTLDALTQAKHITITEKLDGANTSFAYDEEAENGVRAYSRNQSLHKDFTLSGFYYWVQDNIAPIKEDLVKHYRYFGEWLVRHKVVYQEEFYRNFYLFSIWDEEAQEYLSDDIVKQEAERLGLKTVPYIYEGKFISIEHIMQYVGKSYMTAELNKGEGVVVKNIDYRDRGKNQLFVKFISPEFSEVAKQKVHNVDAELIASQQKVDMVVTHNRIEKMLFKLVDEGIIPSDYTLKKDMGNILRVMNVAIYEDVMKEESDQLEGIEEKIITKRIGKIVAPSVRKILTEQGRVE